MPFSRVYERMYLIVSQYNNCSNASVSLITAGRDLWGLRIIEEVLRIKCRQHDTNWKANLHTSHMLGQNAVFWFLHGEWRNNNDNCKLPGSNITIKVWGWTLYWFFENVISFQLILLWISLTLLFSFNPLELLYYLRLVVLLFLYFSLVISTVYVG